MGTFKKNLREAVLSDPEAIQLFSYSTQQNTKFILLINVKMSTVVGILTFISRINTTPERLQARNFFIYQYFLYPNEVYTGASVGK